jgi:acetyl-CoA carboxylase biotin carboxyl carrier protein
VGLSHDDVTEILRIIDESDVDELRIETDGFSLHVVRRGAAAPEAGGGAPAPATEATAPAPATGDGGARADEPDDQLTVPSPMLGTFYRAESPGAAPFVEVGADVEPDTTVCIIEVMKMMNSVPAGVSGTVVEFCARNGELVEYGAPLLRLRRR